MNAADNSIVAADAIDQRLVLDNRLLQVLKDIAVILVEMEDREGIVTKILPLIRQTIRTEKEPLLFVDLPDIVINSSSLDSEQLVRVKDHLYSMHALSEEVVVVRGQDLAPDSPLSVLAGFYPDQPILISAVCHRQTQMGFLAVPVLEADYASTDTQRFLNYLGEVIGIFLKNAHLRQELHRSRQELERNFNELLAVYEISTAISSDMDLDAILCKALDTILDHDILQIQAKGGVFLTNAQTGRLDMVCYRGIGEKLAQQEASIPLGHCLCGIAAQTGEIITSEDCFADQRHHTHYHGMLPHGHIVLPLKVKQKILGVLFLYLPAGVHASKNQINMLSSVASQLAVTIENATLYEKVKHLSQHDVLTGLANRSLMYKKCKTELIGRGVTNGRSPLPWPT